MSFNYEEYIRKGTLPHIWCAGCGHGILMKSIIRAIAKLGIDKNKISVVSGIGCVSRMTGYLDFNTLHTTHGRAITFATGLKMVRPDMTVILVCGDGDAVAIGGNHFIHACRRNIDLTMIVANNYIYGMTGGQVAPTTPLNDISTTTPYGNIDRDFDICRLAEGAGATFVARTTSFHTEQMDQLIIQAIKHKGFSVVDVIDSCWTVYGRRNKFKDHVAMLEWQRDIALPLKAAERMKPEDVKGKILTGIFCSKEAPEYVEEYRKLQERVRGVTPGQPQYEQPSDHL